MGFADAGGVRLLVRLSVGRKVAARAGDQWVQVKRVLDVASGLTAIAESSG